LEVRGSTDIGINIITQDQQARLNPLGINCLRAFPIRGLLVWGARTLSSDSQWHYINVRRFINYVEQSIINGTRSIASRPNDAALLAALREQVNQFLVREWQKGALFGSSPDEAFSVTCDRTTSEADENRTGSVTLDVGVAPIAPGEFVTFRITHSLQGSELLE
jgi:phage tail sheath protein FI